MRDVLRKITQYFIQLFKDMIYNQYIERMISFQEHSPQTIFNCLFCLTDQDIRLKQSRKEAIFIDQFKNHQPKISLRNTVPSHIHTATIKPQLTFAKPNPKRSLIPTKNGNQIMSSGINHAIGQKNLLQTSPSLLQKTNSLRSTNQTNFQPTPSKTTLPKISFTYNKSPQINSTIKQSLININTNFDQFYELDFPPKISLINKNSTSSNLQSQEIIIPQQSEHVSSSTSPLNKIYKATHNQILVSKQLKKKSSNSFQSPNKLKRLSSLGQPFARQKLKIRQTESIREPQDESDLFSIVLSNNSIMNQSNNNYGFLIPIDENQFQTKLSSYKD